MALCISTNFLGKPCPYTATIGDYCILHAGGWDYFNANVAMLWAVYSQATTLLGIIGVLGVTLGSTKIVNVARDGETRSLNLDKMRDSAENLISILDLLAKMEESEMESQREAIENVGETIVRLHEDVLLLIQHLAMSYQRAQVSAGELAGADSV
jgi:hypothetical protein